VGERERECVCERVYGELRVAFCRLAVCERECVCVCVCEYTANSVWPTADSRCVRERERMRVRQRKCRVYRELRVAYPRLPVLRERRECVCKRVGFRVSVSLCVCVRESERVCERE